MWNQWKGLARFAPAVAGALLLCQAGALRAAELHAGDIELELEAGKLHVHGAADTAFGTGYAIFEGSFTTLLSGPRWRTTNPGFDSAPGVFQPSDEGFFSVWGTLAFWDGDSWESSTPKGEVIVIRDSLDESVTVSTAGTVATPDFTGFISDGGPTGSIHQHISFTLQTAAPLSQPTMGAYRLGLQITSPQYESSDPFYLVLNRGLTTEAFEESVHALAVPEPGTYAMMGVGLGMIGFLARRRMA
jgi:hypothetical protein